VARGAIPGLRSPRPLAPELPALYHDAEPAGGVDLGTRFLAGLDEVLAPVLATLDSLTAYLDPLLAPADFLDWLAGWVASAPDETWALERRRVVVARAARLNALRGTAIGLAEQVETYTRLRPEVEESGGVSWSRTPRAPLPGEARPWVRVRLRVPDDVSVDERRVRALVDAVRPAHVAATVEIIRREEAAA
jgi:phage tail-like protein